MIRGIAKTVMTGSALALAVGAVAYSKAGAIRPLQVQTPSAVTPPTQPGVDKARDAAVAAFVGATTLMARPPATTARDIARAEPLTATSGQDAVTVRASVGPDDLNDYGQATPYQGGYHSKPVARSGNGSASDGFRVPPPMMRSRPVEPRALPVMAAKTPAQVTRSAPPITVSRPVVQQAVQEADRKIRKTIRWSTGEFR